MRSPAEAAHERYVKGRRVRVLCRHMAELLPQDCSVLDVGAGDGMLGAAVMQARPDVHIEGIDTFERELTHIRVGTYDGKRLPFPDRSFDVAMFIDVLHHTENPMVLLSEAGRVARRAIVIKDHCLTGLAAHATLRFMDVIGNRRFGVKLPHNYWSQEQWMAALAELRLEREEWRTRLQLYPWWLEWLFGRRLHFAARLCLPDGEQDG